MSGPQFSKDLDIWFNIEDVLTDQAFNNNLQETIEKMLEKHDTSLENMAELCMGEPVIMNIFKKWWHQPNHEMTKLEETIVKKLLSKNEALGNTSSNIEE